MPTDSPHAGCSDLVALGRALRELRKRRGVAQKAVGFDAGVGAGYVSAVELGRVNPSFMPLLRIARTLRVPLSELVALYERNVEIIDPQTGQDLAYNQLAKARRARGRIKPWT